MPIAIPAWYNVRIKPKHDHIAAANLKKKLNWEVFFQKFRLAKLTKRGLMQVVEPLFSGCVFIRCVIKEQIKEIQCMAGAGRMVQFGNRIPSISDAIMDELASVFEGVRNVSDMNLQDRHPVGCSVTCSATEIRSGVYQNEQVRSLVINRRP